MSGLFGSKYGVMYLENFIKSDDIKIFVINLLKGLVIYHNCDSKYM